MFLQADQVNLLSPSLPMLQAFPCLLWNLCSPEKSWAKKKALQKRCNVIITGQHRQFISCFTSFL